MVKKESNLVKNLFNKELEQKPTRDGYGKGLLEAGKKDKNVVALCADLTESTRTHLFAQAFPERFFQVGVAEQNMVTVAAGLGVSGKIPFIASYATFSPGRAWEQIRTTICYNDSNVKIAGHHAGISVGPDGATHQALEDIATMRALPNMRVIVPCDAVEAYKATLAGAHIHGPVYLRFGREKTPVFTTDETPFLPGRAEIFYQGAKPTVAIVACGSLVFEALQAANVLKDEGISCIVVNNHTIKPLDEKGLLAVARKVKGVVSVEEHQVAGGLGSALSELFARKHPIPMEFVGMQDSFGESGSPTELLEKYGLNAAGIVKAVKRLKKKNSA